MIAADGRVTIGRRELLGGSVSAMALVALGALLPAGCHRYPKPPGTLAFFDAQEYAVFRDAARVLLGTEDATETALEVDRLVATMDRSVKRDIRWMLRLFEHGTHLFDLQGRRFTDLARRDQERYVAGWMNSSMGARRLVFRALKLMAALGLYGRRDAWAAIGYAGPWLGRRDADRRVTYEAPVPIASLRRG